MIFHPRLATLLKRLFGPFGLLTRYRRLKEKDETMQCLQLGKGGSTQDLVFLFKALVNKDLDLGQPPVFSRNFLTKREFKLH
jgi:hypothetical protein